MSINKPTKQSSFQGCEITDPTFLEGKTIIPINAEARRLAKENGNPHWNCAKKPCDSCVEEQSNPFFSQMLQSLENIINGKETE